MPRCLYKLVFPPKVRHLIEASSVPFERSPLLPNHHQCRGRANLAFPLPYAYASLLERPTPLSLDTTVGKWTRRLWANNFATQSPGHLWPSYGVVLNNHSIALFISFCLMATTVHHSYPPTPYFLALGIFFSSMASMSFLLWKWGATSNNHRGSIGKHERMYSLLVWTSSK